MQEILTYRDTKTLLSHGGTGNRICPGGVPGALNPGGWRWHGLSSAVLPAESCGTQVMSWLQVQERLKEEMPHPGPRQQTTVPVTMSTECRQFWW